MGLYEIFVKMKISWNILMIHIAFYHPTSSCWLITNERLVILRIKEVEFRRISRNHVHSLFSISFLIISGTFLIIRKLYQIVRVRLMIRCFLIWFDDASDSGFSISNDRSESGNEVIPYWTNSIHLEKPFVVPEPSLTEFSSDSNSKWLIFGWCVSPELVEFPGGNSLFSANTGLMYPCSRTSGIRNVLRSWKRNLLP